MWHAMETGILQETTHGVPNHCGNKNRIARLLTIEKFSESSEDNLGLRNTTETFLAIIQNIVIHVCL